LTTLLKEKKKRKKEEGNIEVDEVKQPVKA